jgi:outer membrane protein assembly factor BamB
LQTVFILVSFFMRRHSWRCGLVWLAFLAATPVWADWRSFRNGGESEAAPGQNLPTSWSKSTGENIAWTVNLPGRGLGSPCIVGDRVFVTACSGYRQDRLHVLCYDAKSGDKLWERSFWATGRTMCHPKMSVAAASPASDGERIFATFSTNDVFCLDLEGNLLWLRGLTRDYPNASNSLGMSSSPVTAGDCVVLQVESEGDAFAIGLDRKTGENRWKIARPENANWTSPTLMPRGDGLPDLVLLQSTKGVQAVDPNTGTAIWNFSGGASTIPSTTVDGDAAFVPSGGLTALKLEPGVSEPEVLWKSSQLSPSTASPIAADGKVFVVSGSGVLRCADAKTGDRLWQIRVEGPFSATPVLADGKLYLFNEDGVGQVVDVRDGVEEGDRVLAGGDLDETILGTPAVAGGALYVRSDSHLWKIEQARP